MNESFLFRLVKRPFIEAWGWCFGSITGRVRQPARFPPPGFAFCAPPPGGNSCIPQEAIHSPQEQCYHAIPGEFLLTHLALPVLSESGEAPSLPYCIRLLNLWVKCRLESVGQSLGCAATWWSTERTKQLSAIDRQERAGPDKRGEVYH